MASWTPLHIANANASTPPLLVNYTFTASGYTIYVTDLSQIWLEQLDRRQLIRRALNEETSIDPSEDTTQLKILLSKIESALKTDLGTDLQLTAVDTNLLQLHIHCPLPPPFDTLQWRIELTPQSPELMRSKFTQPLVEHLGTTELQADELLRNIHEKDHVIDKLLDKLESVGTDMSDVFLGIAGNRSQRKVMSRAQAARHVKGLAHFDESAWRERAGVLHDDLLHDDLMSSVFGRGRVTIMNSQSQSAERSWQTKLKRKAIGSKDGAPASFVKRQESPTTDRQISSASLNDSDGDDLDFQRQATPPSAQKQSEQGNGKPHQPENNGGADTRLKDSESDSATEDEDDLDGPSRVIRPIKQSNSPPHVFTVPQVTMTKPKRLGQLGGKRQLAVDAVLEPAIAQDDSEPDASTTRPKGRIGNISGRKATREVTPERGPAQQPSTRPSPNKVRGLIGGNKQTAPFRHRTEKAIDAPPDEIETGAHVERVEETQLQPITADDPPESSQDRADRKREELKRQLEAKAHVPARKKRRF